MRQRGIEIQWGGVQGKEQALKRDGMQCNEEVLN